MSAIADTPSTVYDDVAYPGFAYPQTHPDRLATVARLFGLDPAPVDQCRVLELGCGDGGNLLPLAAVLPGSEFVGVDLAARPVARGQARAREAELTNVQLLVYDIEQVPDLGRFDYVIAHGVYSWVPPRTRGALLDVCRDAMPASGVAYVSYNAYPGSHLRDMAREVLEYHLRGVTDPPQRVERAQRLMRQLVSAENPSPFAHVLREQLARLLEYDDWLLLHDDLAEISTPFYFHEFMEHATAHGLQFLSEASLASSQLRDLPTGLAELLEGLPPDVIVREQHLDFVTNRMFRQTLLCHREVAIDRRLRIDSVAEMVVASSASEIAGDSSSQRFLAPAGGELTTDSALVTAAMRALEASWPAGLHFAELLDRADGGSGQPAAPSAREELLEVLLDAYLAGVVELGTIALPVARQPGARPRTTPLVRAQLASGARTVTSLRHANVGMTDEAGRRLVSLLDGTRDHDQLRAAIAADGPEDRRADDSLEQALQRLGELGLLQG